MTHTRRERVLLKVARLSASRTHVQLFPSEVSLRIQSDPFFAAELPSTKLFKRQSAISVCVCVSLPQRSKEKKKVDGSFKSIYSFNIRFKRL